MRKRKRVMKIFFTVIVAMLILLLIIYINHQIHLKGENELRLPLGKMVEVDGHNMSVYIEGTGDTTLVFMSGGGTCSPILDFKSLYSLLSDKYQIAVVENLDMVSVMLSIKTEILIPYLKIQGQRLHQRD